MFTHCKLQKHKKFLAHGVVICLTLYVYMWVHLSVIVLGEVLTYTIHKSNNLNVFTRKTCYM